MKLFEEDNQEIFVSNSDIQQSNAGNEQSFCKRPILERSTFHTVSGKPSGRPRLANYRAHLLMLGKVKVLSYYPKAISKRLHNISCALEPEVVTSITIALL